MLKTIAASFLLAFHNIRSHFFHTLLSVLGIVIGVAALVSILSLIDGMERFANEQIARTTSLNAVLIKPDIFREANGVKLKKDSFAVIDYDGYRRMTDSLTLPAKTYLRSSLSAEATLPGALKRLGTTVIYTASTIQPQASAAYGRVLNDEDMSRAEHVGVVNRAFMRAAVPGIDSVALLGKVVVVEGAEFKIVGILEGELFKVPQLFLPITLLSADALRSNPPELIIEARVVSDVFPLKEQAAAWLKSTYGSHESDFTVATNGFRVEQAARAFLLFRVIMGLVVGISVLVGGIGVMNVLLISVTERTVEIGIRKAVGASRRDIMLQFLSESITVAAFGSLMGLLVGIFGTMSVIPIIKAITKVPFQADYTLNTLLIISTVALLVGIIFGTYPAIRASKLDPVEAIRRE